MSNWRDRFREDNELLMELVRGPFGKIYNFVAVLTFLVQAPYRFERCHEFLGCSLSMLKAAIWALVWPIYWSMHATDFTLVHAILGR